MRYSAKGRKGSQGKLEGTKKQGEIRPFLRLESASESKDANICS